MVVKSERPEDIYANNLRPDRITPAPTPFTHKASRELMTRTGARPTARDESTAPASTVFGRHSYHSWQSALYAATLQSQPTVSLCQPAVSQSAARRRSRTSAQGPSESRTSGGSLYEVALLAWLKLGRMPRLQQPAGPRAAPASDGGCWPSQLKNSQLPTTNAVG